MSKRPITVHGAAALVAAEGAVATGFGLFTGYETVIGAAVDPATAIAVTVLALGAGAGMFGCARGLLRGAAWSRSPSVLVQLFALPVAWSLWQSEQYWLAVPLGLLAVASLVLLLSPPTTAWLVHEEQAGDDDTGQAAAKRPGAGKAVRDGDASGAQTGGGEKGEAETAAGKRTAGGKKPRRGGKR
ncbi:hypothetical protein Arub01_06370 [Actinomadura rubrobrunea]|uniref:Integral membrane protein n=1 Tax=Actinomadura rubrobrunea TaxID=115335 RepID=A0A9W6PSY0_9ACTN|nr:hypothetical protein [Actinomadura rubrobrunea]GLW62393.1 hypothetical protein Arub01_06370 [Actinomadura rubrobrunea]